MTVPAWDKLENGADSPDEEMEETVRLELTERGDKR